MCRHSGFCDGYLQSYCRVHGVDMECCDASSKCAKVHLQRDVAMCSTACGQECAEQGSVACVFDRNSVGITGNVTDGGTAGGVWTVPACGAVAR